MKKLLEEETNKFIERILTLYINEIERYYDTPTYTERPNAHTLVSHLFYVMEQTKQKFLINNKTDSSNITPEYDDLYDTIKKKLSLDNY